MAKKRGKAVLVVASGLVLAAVIFIIWKQTRKKKAATTAPTPSADPITMGSGTTPAAPPSPKPSRKFTFPFKTEAEGNAFRAWVNDNYPIYAKSIQLDRKGRLNSYVEKAWKQFGAEYVNSLTAAKSSGSREIRRKIRTLEAPKGNYA